VVLYLNERIKKGYFNIMKRNLRYYFSLWFAKCTAGVLKLIRRKGTSMPGSWAIILCPDFIGRTEKPDKIIGITGTNGKTTIANMVEDILDKKGIKYISNRSGSNVPTGIASPLIAETTFSGKLKNKELGVFEMDERSSIRLFPNIQPDLLVVTNIFRDSYKRNAHTEFITDLLEKYIPDKTKLILNADDPQCSSLKKKNERVYFGIERLEGEQELHDLVHDGSVCPDCGHELEYDFIRYHHIGRAHCPKCGYVSPEADYLIKSLNRDNHSICVSVKGKEYTFNAVGVTPINLYNEIAAIALLCEYGMPVSEVQEAFREQKIAVTRFEKTEAKDKIIYRHLAKGQNPVACSRAFDNTRHLPGKKCVMLFLDDHFDSTTSVENIAWFYDTDFEFLNDPGINQVIIGGARHDDTYVRLLLAGIPKEKIYQCEDNMEAAKHADIEGCDAFVIYYDVYTIGLSNDIKNMLIEKINGRGAQNDN
jgi:UDP-N-acetylmuramyl tripeptide synthase